MSDRTLGDDGDETDDDNSLGEHSPVAVSTANVVVVEKSQLNDYAYRGEAFAHLNFVNFCTGTTTRSFGTARKKKSKRVSTVMSGRLSAKHMTATPTGKAMHSMFYK